MYILQTDLFVVWVLKYHHFIFSPSVLDRLNGLLEPGGTLCINERGVIDGTIPTIVPHPQFRLVCLMYCILDYQVVILC